MNLQTMQMRAQSLPQQDADSREDVEKKKKSVWLDAWSDAVAEIKAFSQCIATAPLGVDDDYRLLIATLNKKLKVYKGTAKVAENLLMDVPVALCSYYMDLSPNTPPAVAVAAGAHIYIYRDLRPHYKFTLPTVSVDAREADIWKQLREESIDVSAACEKLIQARDDGVKLSSRSTDILALDDISEIKSFAESCTAKPLVQETVITAMGVLNKSTDEEKSVKMLVLGTEAGEILFLSPNGASVVAKCQLKSVPVFLSITGLFDVESRVTVACRDSNIYTVKNGEVVGTPIQLESQPCGLVKLGKTIVVGCMNNSIQAFHIKGRKLWAIYMPNSIIDMTLLDMPAKNFQAVMVALKSGEIRLYQDRDCIYVIENDDPVQAMRFGRFAREDNALMIVHRSGKLSIKILPRNAKLEGGLGEKGVPIEQDQPLQVPKKTKLYIEQTQRERDNAVGMHRLFQNDLYKLRLSTAKAYEKVLSDSQFSAVLPGPTGAVSENASIRLSVMVQGIGPQFRIKLTLNNTGKDTVSNLPLILKFDHDVYHIDYDVVKIPSLVPGLTYKHEVDVHLVDSNSQNSDDIRVVVLSPNNASAAPLVSAVVRMPIPELIFQD